MLIVRIVHDANPKIHCEMASDGASVEWVAISSIWNPGKKKESMGTAISSIIQAVVDYLKLLRKLTLR